MLTKEQKQLVDRIKTELLALSKKQNCEVAHQEADDCLCELLEGFGLHEVVEAYNEVSKWYA